MEQLPWLWIDAYVLVGLGLATLARRMSPSRHDTGWAPALTFLTFILLWWVVLLYVVYAAATKKRSTTRGR